MPATGDLPIPLRLLQAVNPMWILEFVGKKFIQRCTTVASILAILSATFMLAMRPASWTPAVRDVWARQILFTGVDGVFAAFRFGAAAGILIIVQAALRMDVVGLTTDMIADILWRSIVRELAPLLACLVVIGRSGVAITTELATMLVNGEIEVLDAQGIDPMTYLVMPRILAVIMSVFCLAILTATSTIVTGYVVGWAVDAIRIPWTTFLDQIIREFEARDLLFFVPKTILAGGFAGAICCIDGLSVRGTVTDVPKIASRSVIHALTAVFGVSAVLSAVIYGQILMYPIF